MSLAGVWENEYGSRMRLGGSGSGVHGDYASTTGSTGRYLVLGHQGGGPATPEGGVPVALAISWHSLAPGLEDASWHWVSALSGQIRRDEDGAERLVLNHLLVASCDFPGLSPAGTFLDKLTYRRVGAPAALPPPAIGPALDHPLAGPWQGGGIGLMLRLASGAEGRLGLISGQVTCEGRALDLTGFVDLRGPQPGMEGTALSLTTGDSQTGRTLALAGLWHRDSQRLEIQAMTARRTPAADSYMQTALRGLMLAPVAG